MSIEYTTCKVEHRDYVPYGWIAVEFCHVDFMGKHAKLYENEWHDIEFEKYRKREKEIKEIEEELKSIEKADENIAKQQISLEYEIRNLRKKLPIFKRLFKGDTEEIKDKKAELEKLMNTKNYKIKGYFVLTKLKKELDEDRFYSQSELMRKIERYLKDKGFRIINSSQSGGECKEQIDIWQKEYN